MILEVLRFPSQNGCTPGVLSDITDERRVLCFTLEDEAREKKVYGATCIPSGEYRVTLRREGRFHQLYSAKYPDLHSGMLWVRDVPNFEWILIHIGNTAKDTKGCLLVGNSCTLPVDSPGFVGHSERAYLRIYPPIASALEAGEKVYIRYKNFA